MQLTNSTQRLINAALLTNAQSINYPPLLSFLPLTNFQIAIASTRSGISDTKILCVGDGVTWGYGSLLTNTFVTTGSYPSRLSALLNTTVTPAFDGAGIPGNITTGTDGRWTVASGWSLVPFGFGGAGNGSGYNNPAGASGTLTFTPLSGAGTVNSFDVYFTGTVGATGSAKAFIGATGGASIPFTVVAGINKITAICPSSGTNSAVNIGAVGNVTILAVEPFLSTVPRIRVANMGVLGSSCSDWNSASPQALIAAYNPSLIIAMFGAQESIANVPSNTFAANVLQFLPSTNVDTILVIPPPLTTSAALMNTYAQAIYGDVISYSKIPGGPILPGIAVENYNARIANGNSSPNYYFNTSYLSSSGYWDLAAMIACGFRQIF